MPLDIDLNVAFTNTGEPPPSENDTAMAASLDKVAFINTGEAPPSEDEIMAASKGACEFELDLNLSPPLENDSAMATLLDKVAFTNTGETPPSEDETMAASKGACEFELDLNLPPCFLNTHQSFPSFDEDEDQADLNQSSSLPLQDEEHHIDSCSHEEEDYEDDLSFESNELHMDHDTMSTVTDMTSETGSKKHVFLSNEQRKAVFHLLLHSSQNGNLNPEIIVQVASLFGVHRSVIYCIWHQGKKTGSVDHKRTTNCGRKRVQLDLQRIRQVPLSKRQTLRSLTHALGISKTSLIRLQKAGIIRRHSNALKPYLKEENMIARLRFCLSMLDDSNMPHDPKFKSMDNIVFIDEKGFYMTKNTTNYYLLADEDEPHRTCKSKNFIGKLMFLVAVARPRFDNEGNETFSGKIGVFPFVYEQPARRTSVNRAAGTMEKKPITSVTKEVNKMFLFNRVLPAIKNVWPREDVGKTIFIQQDNARCHVDKDDEDFCWAASEDGFDIQLTYQPPNSPDLNVLDLGFFNAIQSLQQKELIKKIDDLIEAVEKSFHAFSTKQSNNIFLTLQSCMAEIMKVKGSNKYKIPHMKKDVLYNQDEIPRQLSCDPSLVQEVLQYLENVGSS